MRFRICLIGILLIAVSAIALYAQQTKRVAVLDFTNRADLPQREVDYLTELVRTEARRMLPRDKYLIITKESIQQLLPPDKKNLSECVGECEVETGRMIGAQYLATGEVVKFGGQLRLTVRLYNVETGNLLESRKARGVKVLDLETPIERLSTVLFAVLPGAYRRATPSPAPTYTSMPEPYVPPAKADPAFEELVKKEQGRIEAESRLAAERKAQVKADFGGVKRIHDSASYSDDAKKAAYQKFIEKWPNDTKYTTEVRKWMLGGGLSVKGTIWTDPLTGLTWQVNPASRKMKLKSAKSHCQNLSLGGNTDWRLPTKSELASLIRKDKNNCRWPVTMKGDCSWYWSSTSPADIYYHNAYCVNFLNGHVTNFVGKGLYADDVYVRCVR